MLRTVEERCAQLVSSFSESPELKICSEEIKKFTEEIESPTPRLGNDERTLSEAGR